MMDALGMLVIVFGVMSIISILAVLIQFLAKDEKKKKVLFYFVVVWGLVVTGCNVLMIPPYMTEEFLIAFGIGALSIVALLLQLIGKKLMPAQIIVSISVIAGMIDAFLM